MLEAIFDMLGFVSDLGSPNGKARWFWRIFWFVLIGGGIALALLLA